MSVYGLLYPLNISPSLDLLFCGLFDYFFSSPSAKPSEIRPSLVEARKAWSLRGGHSGDAHTVSNVNDLTLQLVSIKYGYHSI